jgi:hypothetical protein
MTVTRCLYQVELFSICGANASDDDAEFEKITNLQVSRGV